MLRSRWVTAADLALSRSGVLTRLAEFDATVVSSIHAGLDIEGSDIDVVCHFDAAERFVEAIAGLIGPSRVDRHAGPPIAVVGRLEQDGFEIELYGSDVPVQRQPGYRHFRIMQRLVEIGGAPFQTAVRALKRQGTKTEPAVAMLLDLHGDPFDAVLMLEPLDDAQIGRRILAAMHGFSGRSPVGGHRA